MRPDVAQPSSVADIDVLTVLTVGVSAHQLHMYWRVRRCSVTAGPAASADSTRLRL